MLAVGLITLFILGLPLSAIVAAVLFAGFVRLRSKGMLAAALLCLAAPWLGLLVIDLLIGDALATGEAVRVIRSGGAAALSPLVALGMLATPAVRAIRRR